MTTKFEDLKGKILTKITGKVGEETMEFLTDKDEKYEMYYKPDCCASCYIEDIIGNLDDLIGSPILLAEEVCSNENPHGVTKEYQDSFTWTFYKLSTIKGHVTIRWYGESNGYYSVSVTFKKMK